jgi:hypothetical protein
LNRSRVGHLISIRLVRLQDNTGPIQARLGEPIVLWRRSSQSRV